MANYAPSTRARIADLITGMHVKTSVLANATYMIQGQVELFNVYGRIQVLQLYIEACTVFDAALTDIQFNFTSSTPTVAVQPMCAVNAGSLTGLAQGLRIVWVGGAVATACAITATAGISDLICVSPQIIGTHDGTTAGVGTIGQLTSVANQTSGTHQAHIYYIPMSDGAYVTAVL